MALEFIGTTVSLIISYESIHLYSLSFLSDLSVAHDGISSNRIRFPVCLLIKYLIFLKTSFSFYQNYPAGYDFLSIVYPM